MNQTDAIRTSSERIAKLGQRRFTSTGWRVLICDDDRNLRRELAQRLKDQGLGVIKAQSGARAVSYVRKKKIDVAVIDLDMPRLDGINTIERIHHYDRDVRIVVLSARDNPHYRRRALDKHLRIERWIDKSENYLDACAFAVLNAIAGDFETDMLRSIDALAHSARLSPEQVISVRTWIQNQYLRLPEGMSIAERSSPSQVDSVRRDPREFEMVLDELARNLDASFRGFDDPALRQSAWDAVRRIADDELWQSVHAASPNRYKHQLAIQLKISVLKIEAPLLAIKHLEALGASIQRLRSQNVGAEDVAQCERAWEASDVSILPSFAEILEDWERFYPAEDPNYESHEGTA